MPLGLVISFAAHLAVLGLSMWSFAGARLPDSKPVDALPVEFVSLSEITQLREGSRNGVLSLAADTDKKTPTRNAATATAVPAPRPAARTPQPEPAQEAADSAPPSPRPPPQSAPQSQTRSPVNTPEEALHHPPAALARDFAADTAEPAQAKQVLASATPAAAPQKRPRKDTPAQRRSFDQDRIAALLDRKSPDAAPRSNSDPARLGGADTASSDRLDMSEIDALKSQISQCWTPNVGARNAEDLRVVLRFTLTRDGDIESLPHVMNFRPSTAFEAAANDARRAVLRCAPYRLSAEKYNAWREIVIHFDPREWIGSAPGSSSLARAAADGAATGIRQ